LDTYNRNALLNFYIRNGGQVYFLKRAQDEGYCILVGESPTMVEGRSHVAWMAAKKETDNAEAHRQSPHKAGERKSGL